MIVTGVEYLLKKLDYTYLVCALPKELQKQCPSFERFLSPTNASPLEQKIEEKIEDWQEVYLTITGKQRWELLSSPHAKTLLRAYIAQRTS